MKDYINQSEAMGVALLQAGRCAVQDGLKKLKGMLQELGIYEQLRESLEALDTAREMVMATCKDEDYRLGLERRIATYRIGLTHARPECPELHVVDDGDMQTLMGHALHYCDYECPCVTVDEEGERIVNTQAVRACEMRKMYKRLLVTEGPSPECPYSTLIS
ncbi:MAG: hypothetical protein VB099_16440 [Candidatus Limiplasma sp.]|nr:hypothetical protein [Candidatus Limiplasma sp.]